MEIAFWLLIFIVFYTYLGYGILLYFLVKIKSLFNRKQEAPLDFEPAVTLVIPAFNEEDYIAEKAQNSLALDYPKDKLRIIFITDGSTDNTAKIIDGIDGVELMHQDVRMGKACAENRAMTKVKSDFVIFCDANTQLNQEAVKQIVKHYANPKVGAVTGEKKVISKEADSASGAGEGIYWKYESTLKRLDSALYSVVGAAGELVSFRTSVMEDLEEDTILDDFVQSLRVCKKGYRVVYEPNAFAVETASENIGEELKRKIRIAAGGWQSMSRLTALLNPFKYPVLSFQYISHRVLRWSLSAFVLPVIFLLNLLLIFNDSGLLYLYLFLGQVAFYLFASIGWILENRQIKVKVLFIPYYFLMMNYAVFAGFFRWLSKSQAATWERAKRA